MKKRLVYLIAAIGFTLGPFPCRGWGAMDPTTLTAKLEKSEVTIGEPIVVTISGHMPKTQAFQCPQTIEGLKGLNIVTSGSKEGFPLFGQKRFKGWFILKGFEPGIFEIPPCRIKFLGSGGVERILSTQKLTVTIKSLVQGDVEKLDIKDIKGIYKPFPMRSLLLILAILLSVGAWTIYVRITTKPSVTENKPPVPAHILALEKIRTLEQKDLISRGLVAEYYFELSMIVRQYLEARFSIRAPEMTTEEFLASLKESESLTQTHKQLLKEFLSHCDMVKFAKYGPLADENDAALRSARKLIEETRSQ